MQELRPSEPKIDHQVARLWTKDTQVLNNIYRLGWTMAEMAEKMELRVFGVVEKPFAPIGVSIIQGLEESHSGIHTWPEYGYAHFDIVACGGMSLSLFDRLLIEHFDPSILSVATIDYEKLFTDILRPRVYLQVATRQEHPALGLYDLYETNTSLTTQSQKPDFIRKHFVSDQRLK